MTYAVVGADIAKNVMQIHWVNPDSGEIVNKPTTRCADLWLTFDATARPLFGTARRTPYRGPLPLLSRRVCYEVAVLLHRSQALKAASTPPQRGGAERQAGHPVRTAYS